MRDDIRHHLTYYGVIAIVMVLSIFSLLSAPSKQLQLLIVSVTTIFYILLAAIHHYIHHSLNAKIVVEYVLIGSLGLTVFTFVLSSFL